MSQSICGVLNRRTDLSTFVVHLTRDRGGCSARQALDSIIAVRTLWAPTPLGWARDQDDLSEAPSRRSGSSVGGTRHR